MGFKRILLVLGINPTGKTGLHAFLYIPFWGRDVNWRKIDTQTAPQTPKIPESPLNSR
jgi:hypothetical protein